MAAATLSDFIRRRMDDLRTDTVAIEKKYGLDADWIRGFMAGRGQKVPNRDRVRLLAKALRTPESTLWIYIGRGDLAAESQGHALPDETMPAWAVRLEEKVDALSDALRSLSGDVGEVDELTRGLANLMGLSDRARLASFGLQVAPSDTEPESPAPVEHGRERSTNGSGGR